MTRPPGQAAGGQSGGGFPTNREPPEKSRGAPQAADAWVSGLGIHRPSDPVGRCKKIHAAGGPSGAQEGERDSGRGGGNVVNAHGGGGPRLLVGGHRAVVGPSCDPDCPHLASGAGADSQSRSGYQRNRIQGESAAPAVLDVLAEEACLV